MRLRLPSYVGQNLMLGRTTGRTLRLANLANEERLAEAIAANLADVEAILAWNVAHDIRAFRISSSLIPFASHPSFAFDWRQRFAATLEVSDQRTRHAARLRSAADRRAVTAAGRRAIRGTDDARTC